MRIAIITARGGSKRIPRKNIRPFLGKPMIAWPIEAAKESGCFERILVSTDDQEIADVARAFGAEVPFLRPHELSDDYVLAHKAARHALEWALREWGTIEAFCHLYPTAPTLTAETLRESMQLIADGLCKSAWAMLRVPFPVYQFMIAGKNGGLERLFPEEKVVMRSQDMPPAYIDVGQSYAFDTAYFLEHEMLVGPELMPVEVPQERALDIDTEEDWALAERMARLMLSMEK
jgi:pseudaminic acid cytidylyltransferase